MLFFQFFFIFFLFFSSFFLIVLFFVCIPGHLHSISLLFLFFYVSDYWHVSRASSLSLDSTDLLFISIWLDLKVTDLILGRYLAIRFWFRGGECLIFRMIIESLLSGCLWNVRIYYIILLVYVTFQLKYFCFERDVILLSLPLSSKRRYLYLGI